MKFLTDDELADMSLLCRNVVTLMDQQNKKALALSAGFLVIVLFKVKTIVEYLKKWIPDRSRSDPGKPQFPS